MGRASDGGDREAPKREQGGSLLVVPLHSTSALLSTGASLKEAAQARCQKKKLSGFFLAARAPLQHWRGTAIGNCGVSY